MNATTLLVTALLVLGCDPPGKHSSPAKDRPCRDEVISMKSSSYQLCTYPGSRIEKMGDMFLCRCPGSAPAPSASTE
jgi:hypothetical protein